MAVAAIVWKVIGGAFGVPTGWRSPLGALVSAIGRFGFEPIQPYGMSFLWGRDYAKRAMANLGIPRQRAYDALKAMGLGQRKADFLADYGPRLDRTTSLAYQGALPKDSVITRDALTSVGLDFPERMSANLSEKWFHLVEYQWLDETGQAHTSYATVTTNDELTPHEIEDRAYENLTSNRNEYMTRFGSGAFEIAVVRFKGSVHHEGYAY